MPWSPAGERVGLIRFGSRCDVYLPDGVEPLVAVGQRAVAGETVLADGRRNRPPSAWDAADASAPPPAPPPSAQPLLHLVPNMLTILGLCAGLTAIRYALDHRFELAVILIVVAVVLDGLDGRSARMLNLTSKLGAELDSLADFLSFGVAPAVLTYLWTLHEVKAIGWALALLFATCCALRLARFNTELEARRPAALDVALLHRHPGTGRGRLRAHAADHVVRARRRLAAQLDSQRGRAGVRGAHDGQPRADLLDQDGSSGSSPTGCCRP